MRPSKRERELVRRLVDRRGGRIVFLSHCLLDQNVRYLGGAFHSGVVPHVQPLIEQGHGICQMPCPEMRAWGGVHKRLVLPAYGIDHTPLHTLRRPLFRLFVAYTRARYWLLARSVAREIKQYHDAGVSVVAVVGVGASPSCGVRTTLDLARSFEALAGCPFAAIDREAVNEHVVRQARTLGEGMFMRALRRRLRRLRVEVQFVEHDLVAEMDGTAPAISIGAGDNRSPSPPTDGLLRG